MTDRRFWSALLALFLLAVVLRTAFPAADPPWRTSVGVVWHDEGAWTHNARNRVLFGSWRQDEWNPVYIAPVFTALEYASFSALGVGLRQARLVSELAGIASVILLALGVLQVAGRRAALIAAGLLSANFVYVMYDRAATMEALMVAFIVAAWYSSVRAERTPAWGAAAGACAALAFFTKAAAAFYVGVIGLAALAAIVQRGDGWRPRRAAAWWTLAGLGLAFAIVAAAFVVPHWRDYEFYNWQVSVTRKPSYDLRSFLMRLSWFPIVPDLFSRMWVALCLGVLGAWGIAIRWTRATDGERLLLLWLAVGSLELLVHDDGNERRFVLLIPVLVALASCVLARGSLLPAEASAVPRRQLLFAAPVVVYTAYVLIAPVVRVAFLDDIRAGAFKLPVRIAAAGAVVFALWFVTRWGRLAPWLATIRWGERGAGVFLGIALGWNLVQFGDWAWHRTYKNYEASVAVGRALPPGTLVQGKLANGLALENRIRPIFIGHGFGNYADRKARPDVRYILTYTDPAIGFEGDQIVDVLAAYPGWRITMTFAVAETPSGHDTAALIEKRARD